jgi:hypothetical protein
MEFSWLGNKFVTDTSCSNRFSMTAASRRIDRLRGKSDNDAASRKRSSIVTLQKVKNAETVTIHRLLHRGKTQ